MISWAATYPGMRDPARQPPGRDVAITDEGVDLPSAGPPAGPSCREVDGLPSKRGGVPVLRRQPQASARGDGPRGRSRRDPLPVPPDSSADRRGSGRKEVPVVKITAPARKHSELGTTPIMRSPSRVRSSTAAAKRDRFGWLSRRVGSPACRGVDRLEPELPARQALCSNSVSETGSRPHRWRAPSRRQVRRSP